VSHTIGDAPAWDPVDPAATNASFMQLFFNRLVKADMSYERAFRNEKNFFKLLVSSDLAERFEQPDAQTFSFTLRKGVKFHNVEPTTGHDPTAEDVKFAFEAYRQPSIVSKASIFRHVDHIDTPDPYTVKVTMKQPAAYFLYSLAGPLAL